MSTLTIYGLDDHLEQAIRARAAKQHQSASQWIVDTLRHVLESDQESGVKTYHDLDHLCQRGRADIYRTVLLRNQEFTCRGK